MVPIRSLPIGGVTLAQAVDRDGVRRGRFPADASKPDGPRRFYARAAAADTQPRGLHAGGRR